VKTLFAACQVWNQTPPDPRENQPVTSEVPALVMAGEYDPITPPDWGRQVAKPWRMLLILNFLPTVIG